MQKLTPKHNNKFSFEHTSIVSLYTLKFHKTFLMTWKIRKTFLALNNFIMPLTSKNLKGHILVWVRLCVQCES